MAREPRDLPLSKDKVWPSGRAERLAASEAMERIFALPKRIPPLPEEKPIADYINDNAYDFLMPSGNEDPEAKLEYIDKVCRLLLLYLQREASEEDIRQISADLYLFYKPLVDRGMPFAEPEISEHILEHLVWQRHQDPSFPIDYEQCRQLKQNIEEALRITLNVEIPEDEEKLGKG